MKHSGQSQGLSIPMPWTDLELGGAFKDWWVDAWMSKKKKRLTLSMLRDLSYTFHFWGWMTGASNIKNVLGIRYSTLATWHEEPIHWKRPWCWESLRAGWEGGDRDTQTPNSCQRTWVWTNSRRWWSTGKPGVLQSMGVTNSCTWLSDWTTAIITILALIW